MTRRNILRMLAMATAVAGVSGGVARADVKGVADALGVDIHGLVSTVYQYSFNNPDSGSVAVRTSVNDHNSFDLNQGSLFFVRDREDDRFGFNITLDFGKVAETEYSDWDGSGVLGDSAEEGNAFEVREAYASYKIPLGDMDVKVKAGKFVTLLGYEVIKSWNALNYNVSESILFGYSIPFTHTGILADVPIGDMVSLDLGVVNGWDNVQDNNNGKTLLGGLGIKPSDVVSLYFAGTYGAEENGFSKATPGPGAGAKRGVVTANATFTGVPNVTFVIDSVYGHENDIVNRAGVAPLKGDADWYGVAGYAVVPIIDDLSFALRSEVFNDADGVRTLGTTGGLASSNTMWEMTGTLAYQIQEHVLARVEYRHDEASKPIYDAGHSTAIHPGSDTVAAELIGMF